MKMDSFCTWREYIKRQEFRLKRILNSELYQWLSELEFVDAELDQEENVNYVWYLFKTLPVHRNIKGFEIPKYQEIKEVRTLNLMDFKEAWEGLSDIEIQTVTELFRNYDFDALFERFLDIEREKEINQWREQLKGKRITDIAQGSTGNVQFHVEDENGKLNVTTIYIPYTIIKKRTQSYV
ncbi:hypothetical protein M3181_21985 [Mesobacillus maritimus]|uniref:hypothetical protein n=1 Tax=Mesobacillus maritimus TaxID=1643336 RepID=UPI00204175CA|nr:hypothetical protein [Mesobacillus maritimus]MCM3671630.1 hypothetical protein [Mesobacillus maritimus]